MHALIDRISRISPSPTRVWRTGAVLLAVTCGLVATACEPAETGKGGQLSFEYVSPDGFLKPPLGSTPVATGATAEIAVTVLSGDIDPDATLETATSSRPDILEIDAIGATSGNVVRVIGVAEGTAELQVTTVDGITDAVDIEVRAPGSYDITVPEDGSSVLVGGTARLPYRILGSGGGRLMGYGLAPITVSPASAATVMTQERDDTEHLDVEIAEAGEITLTPDGGDAVTVTAVEPARVAEINFELLDTQTRVGQTVLLVTETLLDDGSKAIGLHGLADVSTTEACTIGRALNMPTPDDAWLIEADAEGTCDVSVAVEGVTQTATIDIDAAQ